MESTIFDTLKEKIQSKYYTISDVMTCHFSFIDVVPTGCKQEDYVTENILNAAKNALDVGELPSLNPDFEDYSNDGQIEDKKLSEYILKNCYIHLKDLDVNNDYLTLGVDFKILFLNMASLKDETLMLIQHVKIKSFMGEFEIGEKKEIL